VLMKHINEPPAPVPGLPPALQNVLDRALAKDVDDRFQTPAEFGEAFNQAIQGKADFATLDVMNPKPTRKASKRIFNQKKKRPGWIIPALAALLILAVAAGFMFSGGLPLVFGAASTFTSTTTGSASVAVASNTSARTATPIPALLLGQTGVLQFQDGSKIADQAMLIAAALLAPPTDSQYEVWLVDGSNRLSLGILTLDGSGRGKLTVTQEQGLNLVENYSGVEVTIEPNPDPDPNSSAIVAYSFYQSQEGLTHLRYLLAKYPGSPNETALIQGLNTDIQTINELGQEMQKASANGNADRVKLNAEAMLNTISGDQSPDRKDWNADGQVDDPSDGYGLLLNGRNLGYLQAVYAEADAAVKSPGASQEMVTSGEGLKNSVQNLAQWTEQLKELLTAILADPAPADFDQKVAEAAALTTKLLAGIDANEDGQVEAVVGEAGAQVAYEQAYRMADMPLQAVGILNMGTGTPTFVLVPMTITPNGSGGSSVTGGATQIIPPGQQKTPRPTNDNRPPQKTKKPTGNNGNNNTTTNNGNNKNGN
jgi:hypothetical protein